MRLIILLAICAIHAAPAVAATAADDGSCRKLSVAVTGEERKYGVTAEVYGMVAFASINCAVHWRNNKFCATEMATFDVTAMVIDYLSGEEVEMAKAHFILETPGEKRVVAFAAKSDAEEFVARAGSGTILSYAQLTAIISR